MTKGYIPALPTIFPKEGEIYRHYKGDSYQIVGLAIHSNDDVWMVVYAPLYEHPDAQLFTLPLSEWYNDVSWEGEVRQRFELA